MKSKRTKMCDVTQKVKKVVWERDDQLCIFCGSNAAMPNVHVIPRSKGGLGIEQNVVTACIQCHHKMDQSIERKNYIEKAKAYLFALYGEVDVIYRKENYL